MSTLTALYRRQRMTLPVSEVSHFKADHKYVVAYHPGGELILDDTLIHLEQTYPDDFVRIHRSTLVRRQHLARIERLPGGEHVAHIKGLSQPLPISRRHVRGLRQLLTSQQ